MNRFIAIFIALWLFVAWQPAKAIDLVYDIVQMQDPQNNPYVEVHLSIGLPGLQQITQADNSIEAAAQVSIIFYQSDSSIVAFDKYTLNSPAGLTAEKAKTSNLVDIKRFPLPEGTYSVEISVTDVHNETAIAKANDTFILQKYTQEAHISDIMLVDTLAKTTQENSFSRNNYDIIPMVLPFYPSANNTLQFYGELYLPNAQISDENILLTFRICKTKSETALPNFNAFKRVKETSVIPFLQKIDIGTLPSGNYELWVAAYDNNKQILAEKRKFFQRSKQNIQHENELIQTHDLSASVLNKFTAKQVRYYLNSLAPIADTETQTIIKNLDAIDNPELQKQFIYNFWAKKNPESSELALQNYVSLVNMVEDEYGTNFREGYNTDMGFYYLKYGAPNAVDRFPFSNDNYPYEIWQYYTLENRSNVIFVFVNKEIATDEFKLIHTDFPNEIYNPNWKQEVLRNNNTDNRRGGSIDIKSMSDSKSSGNSGVE
ncbi:MAG: GWxTD domain-containing protein [Chitinophagales bacterium]|nr:GWxTD domain-containing protein [Bacteroidota bacterium]MCB9044193.1 GWxTD domain-containing protein [Chitinophagales bacterium]